LWFSQLFSWLKSSFFYPMCASNVFGTTFEISCADAALLAFFWCKVFLFFSFSGFDFDFLKLNIILVEKMGWGLAQSQRNGLRGKNWLFHFFFFFFLKVFSVFVEMHSRWDQIWAKAYLIFKTRPLLTLKKLTEVFQGSPQSFKTANSKTSKFQYCCISLSI